MDSMHGFFCRLRHTSISRRLLAVLFFARSLARPKTFLVIFVLAVTLVLAPHNELLCFTFDIHTAASLGQFERVQTLLTGNPRLVFSRAQYNDSTPLDAAASRCQGDTVALLLANRADANARDEWGYAPLRHAMTAERNNEAGCEYVVELLLANGADVNMKDSHGKTPLDEGSRYMVEFVRQRGYDQASLATVAVEDTRSEARRAAVERLTDQTVLAKIAVQDKEENIRYAAAGKITDAQILAGVAGASEDGQIQSILSLRTLLQRSDVLNKSAWISLQVMDHWQEYSIGGFGNPIVVSSQSVTLLIKEGERVLLEGNWLPEYPDRVLGNVRAVPPAHIVQTELLGLLCRKSPHPRSEAQLALARVLIEDNRGSIEARDRQYGKTPLHEAAFSGNTEVVSLLLAYKADPNARDNQGETPLHCAARYGYMEVVKLLLAHGADVNAKDKSKRTPLKGAEELEQKEVAELIRQHGGHR